jgi:hypothetical protein
MKAAQRWRKTIAQTVLGETMQGLNWQLGAGAKPKLPNA